MFVDEDLFKFLTRPDNLPVALQVAKHVKDLKIDAMYTFWHSIQDELDNRLQSTQYAERWMIDRIPRTSMVKQWVGCAVQPLFRLNDISLLQFRLKHASRESNYHLYYGLEWTHREAVNFDPNLLARILREAMSLGLTRTEPNWPAWNWHQYHLNGIKFLHAWYNERESTLNNIADDVWNSFIGCAELLEELNASLANG